MKLMEVLGGVLNSWTERVCVHRICYNKPDLKSAMMTRIVRLGLAPSSGLGL